MIYVHKGDLPHSAVQTAYDRRSEVSFDIETTWDLDWRTARIGCITFGLRTNDIRREMDTHIVQLRSNYPVNALWLLRCMELTKYCHYGIFDLRNLIYRYDLTPRGPFRDTRIAAKRINEPSSSLKPLLERYFGLEIPATEASSDWFAEDYTREQRQYCQRDVAYLPQLWQQLVAGSGTVAQIRLEMYCDALPARAMAEVYEGSPDIWGTR